MTFGTIIKVVLPFATGVAFGIIASRKYNEQKALEKYQEDLNEAEELKKKYENLIKEASELDDDAADVKEEPNKDEKHKDDNSLLDIDLVKSRDSENGKKLTYKVDFNRGEFIYMSSGDDTLQSRYEQSSDEDESVF